MDAHVGTCLDFFVMPLFGGENGGCLKWMLSYGAFTFLLIWFDRLSINESASVK